MRYQTKLLIVFGAMLGLSLFAAGMANWGVYRSHDHFQRSRAAHEQLEGYLRLTAHTYILFKQWSDSMLLGEGAREMARANMKRQLEADINILRASVYQEAQLSPPDQRDDEDRELERIAEIRQQLIIILHEFGKIQDLAIGGKALEARTRLTNLLKQSIDKRFRYLIDLSTADEVSEVIKIDRLTIKTHGDLAWAAKIHAVLVTIFTLVCMYFLLRRLRQPLHELLGGTRALSSGDLSHRIEVSGRDEFAELGQSFNQMAEELASQHKSLENAQARLEEEVASRTEELQEANEALEKVDAVRRRFFADISHELRTPLTVIRGEGQITLRGKDKPIEEYKSALERVVEQSKYLSVLVDDLLFIARDGVGELRLKQEDVRIAKLLGEVCHDVGVMAQEKNVSVSFERNDAPVVFSGDRGRLRQLFLILLDNAICYSRPNGKIFVILKEEGDGVRIQVRDEGIGVPEEELDFIFERFGRGSNAQIHHNEGIGLGLPLAKSIAEAHDGTIEISSTVNKGTIVTLSFSPVQILETTS